MRRNAALIAMLCLFAKGDSANIPPYELSRSEAKVALAEYGITTEQRTAYIPVINDLLQRGVSPFGYDLEDKIKNFIPNLVSGQHQFDTPEREDAWRLYLGISQVNETFGISDYTLDETHGYCYKINYFFDSLLGADNPAERIRGIVERSKLGADIKHGDFGVMGGYTQGVSEDERGNFLYYYDVWDLDVPLERDDGFFGKPFVIYDRLYFDEVNYEPERPVITIPNSNTDLM